jgi:voltage-gated potassium channel
MKKLYNITIAILSIVSIALAILDLCGIISFTLQPYKAIDLMILIFFAADYIVRFILSKERKKFFKENIFDLIAIIPFNSIFSAFRIFRLFRIMKLTRLTKLTRVVKAAAFFGILKKKLNDLLNTNGFIYVLYTDVALIIVSSAIMTLVEKMKFQDALWWSIVTCTTVGYGDISPKTGIGRVLAVILMIFGVGFIGMLTGTITTYFTQKQKPVTEENQELETLISSMDNEQKQKMIEIAKIILK